MRYRGKTLRLALVAMIAVGGVVAAACGGGDGDERAALQQEVSAERERAAALEQQLSDAKAQEAKLAKELEVHEGRAVLLYAEQREPPTPAPATTPVPGATPAPPRTPPATYREPVAPFAFRVETLASGGTTAEGWAHEPGCTLSSIFKRGARLVWRIEVIDLSTGKRLLPEDGKVVVKLPHGEDRNASFSQRGGGRTEGAPWMWAANWNIPTEYPVGTLDYEVVVTHNDGRTGSYRVEYTGVQVQIVDTGIKVAAP
jgi:hypothetical protein